MSGAPVQNGPGRFLLQRGGQTAGESKLRSLSLAELLLAYKAESGS